MLTYIYKTVFSFAQKRGGFVAKSTDITFMKWADFPLNYQSTSTLFILYVVLCSPLVGGSGILNYPERRVMVLVHDTLSHCALEVHEV